MDTADDGLRRSKRNKFHLDVAAVLSGASNPDRRRTNLDAKYVSKEANHAVSLRVKTSHLSDPLSLDIPHLEAQDNKFDHSPDTGCQESPELDSRSGRSSRGEPPKLEPTTPDEESLGSNGNNGQSSSEKSMETEPAPSKGTYICPQCGNGFKTKAAVFSHGKFCAKGRSKRKRDRSAHGAQPKAKVSKSQTGDAIGMPVLQPESSTFGNSLSERIKLDKRRKSDVKNIDDGPKLNLVPLPRIILAKPNPADLLRCADCPYTTMDKVILRLHQNMHFGQRQYKCSQCSYSCFSPDCLHKHLDLHTATGSATSSNAIKKRSAVKRKPPAAPEFIPADATDVINCTQCRFRTRIHENFVRHQLEHVQSHQQRLVSIIKRTGTQALNNQASPRGCLRAPSKIMYTCKRCQFKVDNQHLLENHMEYHGGGLLYTCDMCDYSSDDKPIRDFHKKHHHVDGSLTDQVRYRNLILKEAVAPNLPLHDPNATTAPILI